MLSIIFICQKKILKRRHLASWDLESILIPLLHRGYWPEPTNQDNSPNYTIFTPCYFHPIGTQTAIWRLCQFLLSDTSWIIIMLLYDYYEIALSSWLINPFHLSLSPTYRLVPQPNAPSETQTAIWRLLQCLSVCYNDHYNHHPIQSWLLYQVDSPIHSTYTKT